jgi:hypothetical protein
MAPFNPNHLRRLAGIPLNESVEYVNLEESVADDPEINKIIDQEIAGLPRNEQTKYLDAMEVLKAAPNGMDGRAWVAAYRTVRDSVEGQPPETDASKIVADCARMFLGHCIKKNGLVYSWDEATAAYADDHVAAVSGHVDLTNELMAHCRAMTDGTVNIRSLSRIVSTRTQMDPTSAQMIALNFLDAHRGMFTPIGDGTYEFKDHSARAPRGSVNYSDMFRDIANRAKPEDQ